MSSLKFWASEASDELAVTGLHPTLPRSSLTRARIAAWAEAAVALGVLLFDGAGADEDFRAAGAEVFAALAAGAFEAEEEGLAVSFFLGAVVFPAADFLPAGDLDGAAVFEGEAEAEAEADGACEALGEADFDGSDVAERDFFGAAGRSVPRLAVAEAEERSADGVVAPPWVSRSGAAWERTWSAAGPPPTV
ncbi:hypothetical protein JCM13580A_17470 [Streptomyces drozdowiczii]